MKFFFSGMVAGAMVLYVLFEIVMAVEMYRTDCAGLTRDGVRKDLKICAQRFTCAWSKF